MKKMVIIGAGISGLSLAWFLKKNLDLKLDIQIIEKSSRPGGWIQSLQFEQAIFDQGPRSCRTKGNGIETLKLIEDLGLDSQVLEANITATDRYIFSDNTLKKMPGNLLSIITSPWKKLLFKGLWNELTTRVKRIEDESIHSFISRRMNSEIADEWIDPLTLGIYAGDIRKLSIKSCFPDWLEREQLYGGMLKSLWRKKKSFTPLLSSSKFIQQMQTKSLFTLQNGMESLTTELASQMKGLISYQMNVKSLRTDNKKIQLCLESKDIIEADYVCSAVPSYTLAELLKDQFHELTHFPNSICYASVAVVNLGYHSQVLQSPGFGYLIPSKEKEKVLGVVWDSYVFAEQNGPFKSRLCVMLGGAHHPEIETYSEKQMIDTAIGAVAKQLGIKEYPQFICCKKAFSSIPQFEVGHHKRKNEFIEELKNRVPNLSILGTAFNGVSVNDCIASAKQLSESFKRV